MIMCLIAPASKVHAAVTLATLFPAMRKVFQNFCKNVEKDATDILWFAK
jgi:hypothetical protein|tara:strand:- start:95 stop:241 length:147 start_codon:yes stop_codon:yes gene_type:complete